MAGEIVKESIRRLIDTAEEGIEDGDFPLDCPMMKGVDYASARRLAALSIVMSRISQTAILN